MTAFLLASFLGTFLIWSGFSSAAEPITIGAAAVTLHKEDPERERVGVLRYLGGLKLSSPHPRFGGFSGLVVSPDGSHLLAVSDEGAWLSAALDHDEDGHLTGLHDALIGDLLDQNGDPLKGKTWQDAEALSRDDDGSLLVSFERRHRIWRYQGRGRGVNGTPEVVPPPAQLKGAPANGGLEALVSLGGGELLALTERQGRGRGLAAYLYRKGQWTTHIYQANANRRPADAARLANGDVLVLERGVSFFGGFSIGLRRIKSRSIQPDATLNGTELAQLQLPLRVANFEAVAVRQDAQGRSLVYLLSDNNYGVLLETLLLLFRIEEQP